MRHVNSSHLLARRQSVLNVVLKRRNLAGCSRNVDNLLLLALGRGLQRSVKNVLDDVRQAEDGIGALERLLERRNVVVVC